MRPIESGSLLDTSADSSSFASADGRSKWNPQPHLHRSKGDIVRPLPGMQINNEKGSRGEEARLRAQQPAIRPLVEGARALIQLLGVAPDVAPVGTNRARVLRGAANVEQRIPLAP